VHKRGEEVARTIEADVIAAGWPVGEVIGSEAELVQRFGVSRSVLREAVRVVEFLGVARMRRGPGGGLVVTRPDQSAVITAVVVYLTYRGARLEEVLDARSALEDAAVRLAADRATPSDVRRLRARVAAEHERGVGEDVTLHRMIAEVTANPAFELFVEFLARISTLYQRSRRMSVVRGQADGRETVFDHERIVEGIAAGDPDASADSVQRHLLRARGGLTTRQLGRTLGFSEALIGTEADTRLAPTVARRIYSEIVARGWPVGELIGSEADLVARQDVGRAVLREALRLLEFNRIVTTRRGSGGGIFVSAPSRTAVVGAIAVYLESRGITSEHLFEVRKAIELAAVSKAVEMLDEAGAATLEQALVAEEGNPDTRRVAQDVHARIAELTGNRVLSMFVYALTRLSEQHTSTDLDFSQEEAADRMHRAHLGIVEAMLSGDQDLARHRMVRHLDALTPMHQ
jgi:DNA-binding FadR family transcriptional regulator